jgi:hypothetical protein
MVWSAWLMSSTLFTRVCLFIPMQTSFVLIHIRIQTRLGMQLLLSLGADVNCTDDYGRTPLHWAAYDGQVETAQVWIHHIHKHVRPCMHKQILCMESAEHGRFRFFRCTTGYNECLCVRACGGVMDASMHTHTHTHKFTQIVRCFSMLGRMLWPKHQEDARPMRLLRCSITERTTSFTSSVARCAFMCMCVNGVCYMYA